MKKTNLLLVLLVLLVTVNAYTQGELKSTRIISGNSVPFDADLGWSMDLQKYEESISNPVSRFEFLNEQAHKRAFYFANVISYNSKDCKLIESMRKVEKNGNAHKKCFGDNSKFKEPAHVIYYPLHQDLKGGSVERTVGNEIFQGCYYSIRTESEMDDQKLVLKAINAHKKNDGDNFILKNYLESKSHKTSIEDFDNNSFGTCTMYVIHKWVEETGKWRNEVLVFNLTVFGEDIL
jgi:hypothetical protein